MNAFHDPNNIYSKPLRNAVRGCAEEQCLVSVWWFGLRCSQMLLACMPSDHSADTSGACLTTRTAQLSDGRHV